MISLAMTASSNSELLIKKKQVLESINMSRITSKAGTVLETFILKDDLENFICFEKFFSKGIQGYIFHRFHPRRRMAIRILNLCTRGCSS